MSKEPIYSSQFQEIWIKIDQVPANEHLTMQIAKQVFKLKVAENALIFFQNGEPAHLTKRFDIIHLLPKN